MKKEEVGERLDSLENNVRGTFDRCTNFELEECDNAIRRRVNNLEYTLNGLRVATPADVYFMVGKLRADLAGLKEIVEDSRDYEKRETISNLQQTSIELDETIQDLERFEEEGIELTGQNDIEYGDRVGDYISYQVDKFVEENGIKDSNVINEIKAEMGCFDDKKKLAGLKADLSRTHEQISVGMKKQIKAKVEYVGEELVSKKKERDENQKEVKEQKSPIAGLEGLTATETEIAEYDTRSENEKAFKDTPTRDENTRKDLESMFK